MDKQIKRKILFINSVCNGSTGKICKDLYDIATNEGYECCIVYGRGEAPNGYKTIKIGNEFDLYAHVAKTRLFDEHGFGSKRATTLFLKQVDLFKPDIIHLHNIHGYYINIELLFDYLKQHNEIKVIWTLHDCWAFTGHCAYFTFSKCDQWIDGCRNCQSLKDYPKNILFSSVNKNYFQKKNLFTSLNNLFLVTPSNWLKELVKQSFLKEYPCFVIHNGIDTHLFKKKNIIRNNKVNILGAANVWDNRKGLKDFYELNNIIDHNKFEITLVGLSDKQLKTLPNNILGIKRTKNIEELVDIYNKADILFNPTLEDNYPTVNLEAQACGTPVATYNNGGSRETLFSRECFVVSSLQEFITIIENNDLKMNKINFHIDLDELDKNKKMKEYIDLYKL